MILRTFIDLFKPSGRMSYYEDGKGFPAGGNENLVYPFAVGFENTTAGFWDSKFNGWYMRLGSSNSENVFYSGKMIEPITTITNVSIATSMISGKVLRTVNANFRNDTSSDIVVKEIGIGASFSLNGGEWGKSIIARKVLSTPITIHPGEGYNFSYAIST